MLRLSEQVCRVSSLRKFRGDIGAVVEPLEGRRFFAGGPLAGTVIGTSGSYGNDGNTVAKAFDGTLSTYFDGPTANGDTAGLNLGTPATVTGIKYAPRSGYESRMVGGTFQGSSSASFSSGVVNLYTVAATPKAGTLTAVSASNPSAFQYLRYVSPAGSYGNVAEIEFDGAATTTRKLNGTVIGTTGAYQNGTGTRDKAFDGSLSTYVDGANANGNWTGLDLGTTYKITNIEFAPRAGGYAGRMVGGIFQGSNTADFSSGMTNLYTVTSTPPDGTLTGVTIGNAGAFRYVRYLSPAGSFGNVAEVEFFGTPATVTVSGPHVISSSPAGGATGVGRTAFVSVALSLPNGGLYPFSLTDSTVYLYRTSDGVHIPAVSNTDAAGSAIVLQPNTPLDANTSYTFVITSGVTDVTGVSVAPFSATFTTNSATIPTDPGVAFSKTALTTTSGQSYTGLVIGPDGNLYASTLTGDIFRFGINGDGTLGSPTDVRTIINANGGAMIVTGIAFDPSSTATNLKLWCGIGSGVVTNAADFTGKIVVVSGPNLSTYAEAVVGLPRSNSNHLNNQPVFGPDGALYWGQGSNTSMGAPDAVWGYRSEHLLNGAILRLDVGAIAARLANGQGPVNAQTDGLPAGQSAYNPYGAGAPLTIYATGVRNAYDLVFAGNGHLYAPTNGAAATGNIPGTPAGVTPAAPAVNDVPQAEDDFLYDVVRGGYYGHPDPARGQYIFDGGNPVNPAAGQAVESSYPLGQVADPNYRGYAYDFGPHYSADGIIQYKGTAFGGALNGELLVVRYSGGKDIFAMTPAANGAITTTYAGITGFAGFNDPVDLIEDDRTGYIYVAELGGMKLTLLKPMAAGTAASTAAAPTEVLTTRDSAPAGSVRLPTSELAVQSDDGNQPAIKANPQGGVVAEATVTRIVNKGRPARFRSATDGVGILDEWIVG